MKVKPVKFSEFRGKNNVAPASQASEADLQTATNVDINDAGKIRTRRGYRKIYNGTVQSVFSVGNETFFKEGEYLKKLKEDQTAEVLKNNLRHDAKLASLVISTRAYFSDGDTNGILEGSAVRSWGLPVPSSPMLSETVGGLEAGRYLVAVTFERSDGQESGSEKPSVIDITQGGITISSIPLPMDETVARINVYASGPDGEVLYRIGNLNPSAATYEAWMVYNAKVPFTKSLKTALLQAPPPGDMLAFYRGRLYIVDGNVIWFTEQGRYELFNLARNYWAWEHPVTMVGPVVNGMWVSTTEEVFYIDYKDPFQVNRIWKSSHGAIKGTAMSVDGEKLNLENANPDPAWIWASTDGVCIGTSDGFYKSLTSDRYTFPKHSNGLAMIRDEGDSARYLVGLYYSRFVALPMLQVDGTGTIV